MRRAIDQHAVRIPRESGLLPCLYVPVAARDADSIERYVGRIDRALSPEGAARGAVLVEAYESPERDQRLAIWDVPQAAVLHSRWQVWVHVDYRAYWRAFRLAFPEVDLTGLVLDHVMNRRVARLKGFSYLRIVPISRGANSSHGSLNEGWAVEYHGSPGMMKKNRESLASVQYADIADIVKMLDVKGGGSFMDNVNAAQKLVDLPDASGKRRKSATRAN
jgi:hypothetical protein